MYSVSKMDKRGQNGTSFKCGGAKGMCVTVHHLVGSEGMLPPEKFLNFRRSENASDAFSGHSCYMRLNARGATVHQRGCGFCPP